MVRLHQSLLSHVLRVGVVAGEQVGVTVERRPGDARVLLERWCVRATRHGVHHLTPPPSADLTQGVGQKVVSEPYQRCTALASCTVDRLMRDPGRNGVRPGYAPRSMVYARSLLCAPERSRSFTGAERRDRSNPLSGRTLQLVLDGAANPGRHGAVVARGAVADLFEEFWRETHRDRCGQPSAPPMRRTLRLSDFGPSLELVLLVGCHCVIGHWSLRY